LFASHSFDTSAVHSFPVSRAGISGITLRLLARSVRAAYRSRVLATFVRLLVAAKWSRSGRTDYRSGGHRGGEICVENKIRVLYNDNQYFQEECGQ
jgi:hypothetical protein